MKYASSARPERPARSQACGESPGRPLNSQASAATGDAISTAAPTARAAVRSGSPVVLSNTFQVACRPAATSDSARARGITRSLSHTQEAGRRLSAVGLLAEELGAAP